VAFVINAILQSVFCLMVLHLGKDTQVLADDATTNLEVWFEQADSGEVAGVCGSDLDHRLSTSFLQMIVMDEARNYFEEAIWGLSWGPLLTMMVIALWSGTMVSHGRRLFDFTVALWEHTHFELADWNWRNASTTFTVHLKSVEINLITFPRFLLMCFSVVLQLSVITILLVFGCMWMAKTSSVTELLLNAVSLAFITETDELVFITIVPTIIKNFVKKAEPLPLKPPRTSLPPLRSVVSLLTIITSTVLFTVFPVRETSQRMAEVTSLCDDRRIA